MTSFMPSSVLEPPASDSPLRAAVVAACQRIAPLWPLDRFIAVNPWWGFTHHSMREAGRQLSMLNGTRMTMPPEWYRAAFARGDITPAALGAALRRQGRQDDVAAFMADATPPQSAFGSLCLSDKLQEAHRPGMELTLTAIVTHAIGQHCAAWFDRGQASWPAPASAGLYAAWREAALHDHGLSLLTGISGVAARIARLPEDPALLCQQAIVQLEVPVARCERYFTALLLSINGWAGWCAYLGWQAAQQGREDDQLQQLLAIRLAWEWVLADLAGDPAVLADWRQALDAEDATQAFDDTAWVWQDALELGWQQRMNAGLARAVMDTPASRPTLEAVFCIDVRSEPLRRALESQGAGIRTHGFAGFFGLPLAYQPPAAREARPQLPGLLAPSLRAILAPRAHESSPVETVCQRLATGRAWQDYRYSAGGGFGFVESLGLGYLWKLMRDSLGWSAPESTDGLTADERAALRPALEGVTLAQAAHLAGTVLSAMSMPHDLAPWVLLVGHGAQTVNNPHAAGLDCGACCGQTGEVNARVLAALLNRSDVRAALAANGRVIPSDTRFVAALHDTVTDDIRLFDLPDKADLHAVISQLADASARTRRERAPRLGRLPQGDAALARALRRRSRDWSEVRPEWGLANNAGFLAAPRARSRHLDLQGRCFLHDYDAASDEGYRVLELILSAPVVVAHWINLQYYASTVDNRRWGSGDKVLHNIVGGNIGVFEGNGGDLRSGLPLQSLHDGRDWMHTPLRLTVWVEAPSAAIEAILQRQAQVRALVEGGWLHLFSIEPGTAQLQRREPNGTWTEEAGQSVS